MGGLVIVESPAKAKTISKYLGHDFKVMASYGHVRELPHKNGSVDTNSDFKMLFQVSQESEKVVKTISSAAAKVQYIYLATDPDREGEAISWHVMEALKAENAIKEGTKINRVSFNAITKKSVLDAMSKPRQIDMNLVEAQLARSALDYLVGFGISPILWKKLPGSKSAGRVQSAALRIVCDRENEIEDFQVRYFWSIDGNFSVQNKDSLYGIMVELQGKKLEKFSISSEEEAKKISTEVSKKSFVIEKVDKKDSNRNPPPPFVTSTLQQDASLRLGFSPKKTMQVAQKLYEGILLDNGNTVGLITYMRTDGLYISEEGLTDIRQEIISIYGSEYIPNSPRYYKSKIKNAQEAHEAIRPTDPNRSPEKIAAFLNEDQKKLYSLIWHRTMASQMSSAKAEITSITIKANDNFCKFRCSGSITKFPGFLKAWPSTEKDEKEVPNVSEGDTIQDFLIQDKKGETQPPAKYTEASLIKKMEEMGIGRPSTYASITSILLDRKYVDIDKKRLKPSPLGRIVCVFLKLFFSKYVEYDFTAAMEEELDDVSNGKMNRILLLNKFWTSFNTALLKADEQDRNQVAEILESELKSRIFPKKEDGSIDDTCPKCGTGRVNLRFGRFGGFLGCSNYPTCDSIRNIFSAEVSEIQSVDQATRKILGEEEDGSTISIRKGPYGWYLQKDYPEGKNKKNKPKRTAIPANISPESIDIEKARIFLSLPMQIASDSKGSPLILGIGRFGPYLSKQGIFVSLKKSILDLKPQEALEIFESGLLKKEKRNKKSGT